MNGRLISLAWAGWLLTALSVRGAELLRALDGRPLDTPPRVISQAELKYPDSLADRAVYGEVLLESVVDRDGQPTLPRVLRASHPDFVAASVEALAKSKFSPGIIDRAPVAAKFSTLFRFEVRGRYAGTAAFSLPAKSPPETPPEFQYTVAPQIQLTCDPVYPREKLLAKTAGEAEARFIVGRDGRVAVVQLLSASQPEFGAALVAAIERWMFAPGRKESGEVTMTLFSLRHRFTPGVREWSVGYPAGDVLRQLRSGGKELVELAALDRPPRPIYQVAPQFPRVVRLEGVAGEAEVEFIIDRMGHAQFPRIVSATAPEFGWSAATAVQQWFYEPPLAGGKPVNVRVRLPLEFRPDVRAR